MSLAPKIDEVCHVVQKANFDFVCITESWLKPQIQDCVVSLDGFNPVRRDRKEAMHGGVCTYLADDLFEVLWLELRPFRLPRGVKNIVIAVTYHPPSAPNLDILNYLMKYLSTIESKYSGCGIILLGDVNKLDTTILKTNHDLMQTVHFPTCGRITLDQNLTNLGEYYNRPVERPAFGLYDFCSIEVQPKLRSKNSENRGYLKIKRPAPQ